MGEQCNPLHLEHLAQPQRARLVTQRRTRDQRLAGDDPPDQAHDLLGRRQPVRPRLPCLDSLAAWKRQPPPDARLRRKTRQGHAEALEIAVGRVVVVRHGVVPLGLEPVLLRRAAVPAVGDVVRAAADHLVHASKLARGAPPPAVSARRGAEPRRSLRGLGAAGRSGSGRREQCRRRFR